MGSPPSQVIEFERSTRALYLSRRLGLEPSPVVGSGEVRRMRAASLVWIRRASADCLKV